MPSLSLRKTAKERERDRLGAVRADLFERTADRLQSQSLTCRGVRAPMLARDVKFLVQVDLGPAAPKEQGLFVGRDPEQPGTEGTGPAEGSDVLEGCHEGL